MTLEGISESLLEATQGDIEDSVRNGPKLLKTMLVREAA